MKITERARSVRTRDEFIEFVYALNRHLEEYGKDNRAWENNTLGTYLGGIARWTKDMDGVYKKRKEPIPEPSWNLFAVILLSAMTYE